MEHKDFETAVDAAKRFNVTVRAVQKWAAAGKIDGAKKIGRTWFIPKDAVLSKDAAETKEQTEKIYKISDFRPTMPLLNASFELGHCLEYVQSIPDEDDRNIAMAEYLF